MCSVALEAPRVPMSAPAGASWLGRLAAVRGSGGSAAARAVAGEDASTSAAAAAPLPSPDTLAKAEATKKYIEHMYRERDKAASERLERRRSLDRGVEGVRVPWRPSFVPARPARSPPPRAREPRRQRRSAWHWWPSWSARRPSSADCGALS